MKRAAAFYLLIFGALFSAWACFAQVPMTGAGLGSPSSGGVNNTALDGSANAGGGSTSQAVTLTTTQSNDIIIVFAQLNGANPINTSVSGGSLSWIQRACVNGNGNTTCTPGTNANEIEEWYAIAASPLSSTSITVSNSAASYAELTAFGVSGANTSTKFDVNASVPALADTSPISINTSNANDFVICGMRSTSGSNPFPNAGWTSFAAGSFSFQQWKKVTSTQSGLACSATNVNGLIEDAIVSR